MFKFILEGFTVERGNRRERENGEGRVKRPYKLVYMRSRVVPGMKMKRVLLLISLYEAIRSAKVL